MTPREIVRRWHEDMAAAHSLSTTRVNQAIAAAHRRAAEALMDDTYDAPVAYDADRPYDRS